MTRLENYYKPTLLKGESIPDAQVSCEHVEIYVFSTYLADYYQQFGTKKFFEQLAEQPLTSLDTQVIHQPIFLNKQAAFQYARCIDNKHIILKAYVPESFIIGQPQALALRKYSLKRGHIQGIFLGWVKNTKFLTSPVTMA